MKPSLSDILIELTAMGLLWASVPAAIVAHGVRVWRHGGTAIKRTLSPRGLFWPALAVLLVLGISHRSAVDQAASAGRIIQWLCYCSLFSVAVLVPRIWQMYGLLFPGSFMGVFVILGAIRTGVRSAGILGNPNVAGGLLAVISPVFGDFLEGGFMIIPLVATGSRGAFLSVFSAFAWDSIRKALVLMPLVVVAGLVLALARPNTVSKRLGTWEEAGRLFLERPLVGWGSGSYPLLSENETEHPHADSLPMTIAAENGLLGLLAFGWLAVEFARIVARSDDPARLGLVAFATHNLVDCMLWWYWVGIAAVLCAAVVARGDNTRDDHRRSGSDLSPRGHKEAA
jgi:hypothetical protein